MKYLTNFNNSGILISQIQIEWILFLYIIVAGYKYFMKGKNFSTLFCTLMSSVKWLPVCLLDQNIQIRLHFISDEVRFLYTYLCNRPLFLCIITNLLSEEILFQN